MNLTVTPAAEDYIKKMLSKNQTHYFRLSVKKTGCSGYAYLPTLVEAAPAHDIVVQLTDINIYIDATWRHILEDIHIDYIEEGKMGLKQKRLVFTNPKETNRCGCGESFHIED